MPTFSVCICNRKMIPSIANHKLFLSSIFLLLLTPAFANLPHFDIPTDLLSSSCGGSKYIMNGSVLESNLKEVLSSLVENVNNSGYNISWYGQNGDKIYGLAQCRGDLNASICRECASYAKMSLTQRCHGHSAGSIHLSGCFLRYGTHNFYSKLDTSFSVVACGNSTNSTTDAPSRGLDWPVTSLLFSLVEHSLYDQSGFFRGSESGFFALSQCWGDINRVQCNRCLLTVYNGFSRCPNGTMQGEGLQINCMTLFATHKFYSDSALSSHLPESPDHKPLIMLALTIGGFAIFMIVVGVIVVCKREAIENRYEKPPLPGYCEISSKFSTAISKSKLNYKSQILYTATNDFNSTNKIGEGGFGAVYKGILSEDENMGKMLDWFKRFEIILGTASGLAYLHEESEIRIIHRDIKASNILLDQHFRPKIADFGLVRYFAEDQTHLSTIIVGTRKG